MSAYSTSAPAVHDDVDEPALHALAVDVQDFAGVERVISLLRGRRYDVRTLRAASESGGRWVVEFAVQTDNPGVHGLHARLGRLVSVVDLRTSRASDLQLLDK